MGYSGVWDNLVRWYTLCIDGNITYNPVSRWWCDSHGVGFRVAHTQFDIRGAQQEHWTLWEQDAQKRGRGFVAQVDQQPIANRPRLLADLSRSEPGAGTTLQRLCPTYPNSTEQQISRWLDPRWIDCYMAGTEDNDNYVERRITSYANSEDKTYSKRHWKTHLPEHHGFSSCGTCPKLHSPRTWLVVKSPFSLEHVPAEDCNILGIPGV